MLQNQAINQQTCDLKAQKDNTFGYIGSKKKQHAHTQISTSIYIYIYKLYYIFYIIYIYNIYI